VVVVTATPPSNPSPESLAAAERKVSGQLADGPYRYVLLGCAVVYLLALFLPFSSGANGWQLLGATAAAREAEVKITEYLFTWFSLLGVGILAPAAVLSKRYAVAAAGWVITVISLVFFLMAIWLGVNHGAGKFLAVAAVLVAVFTYIPAIFRRGEDQREIARERAAAQGTDQVARLQRAATEQTHPGGNPLLVDDRRVRAAERHKWVDS